MRITRNKEWRDRQSKFLEKDRFTGICAKRPSIFRSFTPELETAILCSPGAAIERVLDSVRFGRSFYFLAEVTVNQIVVPAFPLAPENTRCTFPIEEVLVPGNRGRPRAAPRCGRRFFGGRNMYRAGILRQPKNALDFERRTAPIADVTSAVRSSSCGGVPLELIRSATRPAETRRGDRRAAVTRWSSKVSAFMNGARRWLTSRLTPPPRGRC